MPSRTTGAAHPPPSAPPSCCASPTACRKTCYFAACIRAEESAVSELDENTIAYHFKEPMGVVGPIIPWNFPLLMAAWKLAPAIGAGNCVVIKPASNTPLSLAVFAELTHDILPPGVLNVVTGPGAEIGKALASNKRIAKIAFTGETVTGRLIMQYASEPIIPQTLELGGKSPNIFFADVMDHAPGRDLRSGAGGDYFQDAR